MSGDAAEREEEEEGEGEDEDEQEDEEGLRGVGRYIRYKVVH